MFPMVHPLSESLRTRYPLSLLPVLPFPLVEFFALKNRTDKPKFHPVIPWSANDGFGEVTFPTRVTPHLVSLFPSVLAGRPQYYSTVDLPNSLNFFPASASLCLPRPCQIFGTNSFFFRGPAQCSLFFFLRQTRGPSGPPFTQFPLNRPPFAIAVLPWPLGIGPVAFFFNLAPGKNLYTSLARSPLSDSCSSPHPWFSSIVYTPPPPFLKPLGFNNPPRFLPRAFVSTEHKNRPYPPTLYCPLYLLTCCAF